MNTNQQDLAFILLRSTFGVSIFLHGRNKISGISGTAVWFQSIGMRRPKAQALMAATTEILIGVLLTIGFLTKFASAGLIALMIVGAFAVHGKNGYFIFRKNEGWEYCLAVVNEGVLFDR